MAEGHDSTPIPQPVLDSCQDLRETITDLCRDGSISDTASLDGSLFDLLSGLDDDFDRGVGYGSPPADEDEINSQ